MVRVTDYDAIAAEYDRRYENFRFGGVEEVLLDFVRSERPPDVLDVGCGTGRWLRCLVERGLAPAGVDLSAGMLGRARLKLPTARLARGRAEALPWRSGAFDRLVCINALHHFGDRERFLAEARRVLRPGGTLMVVGLDPHARPFRWWIYDYFPEAREIDRERYPSAAEIREAMGRAGFSACRTRWAEQICDETPLDEAEARGLLERASTSQLSVLSEDEYRAGRERLRHAEAAAAARGETLTLPVDIVLYCTVGQ